MYADGDLGRDEYKELCAKTDQEISALQHPPAEMAAQQKAAATPSMKELTAALNRIVDLSAPKLPDSLIQEFVEVVTPIKDNLYRWKLNFGPQVPHSERTDLTKIEQDPLLKFRINFETARQYRQKKRYAEPVQTLFLDRFEGSKCMFDGKTNVRHWQAAAHILVNFQPFSGLNF